MAEAIFLFCVVAALVLMLRAPFSHSWPLLWVSALISFVASILGMFSIGVLVFMLTCLQLAAVAAMRPQLDATGWAAALLTGLLVWVAIVPVQYVGPDIFGGTQETPTRFMMSSSTAAVGPQACNPPLVACTLIMLVEISRQRSP